MKKCPYCAEEIQDEAIKCKHCGEMMPGSQPGPVRAGSSPAPGSGPWAAPPVFQAASYGSPAGMGQTMFPAAGPAAGLRPGDSLRAGRYRIEAALGKGGMAEIYRAVDTTFNLVRALKIVPPEVYGDARYHSALKKEALLVMELRHDLIRTVHNFDEDAERQIAFLVMEYVDGLSLHDLQAKREDARLTEPEAIAIAANVFQALAYAHGRPRPVVHRDVKPMNVFVTGTGDLDPAQPLPVESIAVKLMDFGLGATVRKTVLRQSVMDLASSGTLQYMSPEQLDGADPAPSMDVYAAGATLYEMLQGDPPFYRGDVATQVRSKAPRRIEGVTPALWDLVAACLEKDPAKRPTAAEAAQRLGALSTASAATVPAPTDRVVVADDGTGHAPSLSAAFELARRSGIRLIQLQPGRYQDHAEVVPGDDWTIEAAPDTEPAAVVVCGTTAPALRVRGGKVSVTGVALLAESDTATKIAAVDVVDGTLILNRCVVRSTTHEGIQVHGSSARAEITGSALNRSAGSAVDAEDGASVLITDCEIAENAQIGVAVAKKANATVRNCRVYDGAMSGICFWDGATGLLEDCDVFGNAGSGVTIWRVATATVRGCKIHDGKGNGVSVFEEGTGLFENCDIFANANAGVATSKQGAPTVRGCQIHDGKESGVFVLDEGRGLFENCNIFGNTLSGVAVKAKGNPTVRGCKIHDGKGNGVNVYEEGAGLFENCDIFANANGVAVATHGNPMIRKCSIHDGLDVGAFIYSAGRGLFEECDIFANANAGVATSKQGAPTVRGCKIHDGKGNGVNVYEEGTGLFENCDIFANANAGVAMSKQGAPTVRGCQIHDGKESGVFVLDEGRGLFENCNIFGNTLSGVAVKAKGNPTVRGCKIHDGKGNGVNVYEEGAGLFENCDIFANANAGVLVWPKGNPTIRGSEVRSNKAYGIRVEADGAGTFENCTASGNASGSLSSAPGSRAALRDCFLEDPSNPTATPGPAARAETAADPKGMFAACPQCGIQIVISADKVPDRPFKVRCPKCQVVMSLPGRPSAASAPVPSSPPPPSKPAAPTCEGRVKWFNESKGYGYISREGGPDVFVHHSEIRSEGIRTLSEGDRVRFEITLHPKGPRAANVTKL